MIQLRAIAGEQVLDLPGRPLLVASKSAPGVFHETTESTCDCRGFAYRGHCRHVDAARALTARRNAADGEWESFAAWSERRVYHESFDGEE